MFHSDLEKRLNLLESQSRFFTMVGEVELYKVVFAIMDYLKLDLVSDPKKTTGFKLKKEKK